LLRFEACARFDLLHSEALHLRRPAVLCGQPKIVAWPGNPPPPAPPQCGALSPKRLLVPSLSLYLLLLAQGPPPPSLRHAQRMQSALTKGWNRLGPFGAAKLPSKPHNSKHRCVIAPPGPPPFSWHAPSSLHALLLPLACISQHYPLPQCASSLCCAVQCRQPKPELRERLAELGSVGVAKHKEWRTMAEIQVGGHTPPPPSSPQV
jgi:hypothetical protein